jgi:VWFA-related protein
MPVARIGLLISVFAFAVLHAAAPQVPVQPSVQATPAAAAAPDSDESLPTIHVTTRLVVLDVVVSDGHNHSAAGLKASDFHLTENGVPQTIDSFTEHDVPPLNPSVAETEVLPPNTFAVQPSVTGNGAMTVIVLGGFGPFIRDQLKLYFQTADLATPTAIFRTDWQGMHLVQGFTADRKVLLDAVNSQRIWPPLGPRFHADPASFRIHAVGTPTQRLAAYLAGIPGRINLIWVGRGAPTQELDKDFPDQSTSLADVSNMIGSLNRTTDVRRLSRVALSTILTGTCGGGAPSHIQVHFGSVSTPFTEADMQPVVATPADAVPVFAASDLDDLVVAAGGRIFRCTDPAKAIAEVTATGSHYYTISYRPTNSNWNGAYRSIHLDVTGYEQPPLTLRWYQLVTDWADDIEPTVLYRQGYFARSAPSPPNFAPDFGSAARTTATPDQSVNVTSGAQPAPRRRLISISPKGDLGPQEAQIQAAMTFGNLTPTQVHFTIVVTPAPEKVKTRHGTDLPPGNFLTIPFRDTPYRNYRIHYWIDPQDLHFVRTPSGLYHNDLRTIAILYRDDGVTANSFATTAHFDLTAADVETIQASGFSLDQTVAVPTYDNFFLRTAVSEQSTGHIGAIEIPAEWAKVPPPNTQSASQPAR